MLLEQVRKLNPVSRWLYFIQERETVRLVKEAGMPPPWTDDEILQSYRFCNVRRMDDKVSRWLLFNWYEPYKDHPNMLAACALARFINLPSTLEAVGFPERWRPTRIKQTIRKIKAAGRPFMNAAYMVRGNDGDDKIESIVDYYVQPLVDDPPAIDPTSMERSWAALVERFGFGSFMAGQVVADLRWGLTGSWRDRRRWAPLGPGSKRGMNRLLENPIDTPMTQADFTAYLNGIIDVARRQLPKRTTRRMEAIDWQNTLCEFDKHERVLWGDGRPKQLYAGRG